VLNDTILTSMATHASGLITHIQLHSGLPGAAGTSNVTTAARVATAGKTSVDADGDITWTGLNFTGVAANGGATHISYWSAVSAGTYYGYGVLSGGDTTANAAGEFNVTSFTESGSATA
jgi:hypothetical protein